MDIELLKKLTRLANNNPNEHEANMAARRVCKMLEKANWSLSGPMKEVNLADIWEGVVRKTTVTEYEETQRQQKQREKYRREAEDYWGYYNKQRPFFHPDEWYWDHNRDIFVNKITKEKITKVEFEMRRRDRGHY